MTLLSNDSPFIEDVLKSPLSDPRTATEAETWRCHFPALPGCLRSSGFFWGFQSARFRFGGLRVQGPRVMRGSLPKDGLGLHYMLRLYIVINNFCKLYVQYGGLQGNHEDMTYLIRDAGALAHPP